MCYDTHVFTCREQKLRCRYTKPLFGYILVVGGTQVFAYSFKCLFLQNHSLKAIPRINHLVGDTKCHITAFKPINHLWSVRNYNCLNISRPGQNGRYFVDGFFWCIFLNKNIRILIRFSLKFIPKGPIDDKPVMDQIMVWHRCCVQTTICIWTRYIYYITLTHRGRLTHIRQLIM